MVVLLLGSQLQKSVMAASTMEAELNAACEGCKETMYLRGLLVDLSCEQVGPTSVYSDNQSRIELCKHDSAHHSSSKHIDVRFHFVRDEVKGKTITVFYVPTHSLLIGWRFDGAGEPSLRQESASPCESRDMHEMHAV